MQNFATELTTALQRKWLEFSEDERLAVQNKLHEFISDNKADELYGYIKNLLASRLTSSNRENLVAYKHEQLEFFIGGRNFKNTPNFLESLLFITVKHKQFVITEILFKVLTDIDATARIGAHKFDRNVFHTLVLLNLLENEVDFDTIVAYCEYLIDCRVENAIFSTTSLQWYSERPKKIAIPPLFLSKASDLNRFSEIIKLKRKIPACNWENAKFAKAFMACLEAEYTEENPQQNYQELLDHFVDVFMGTYDQLLQGFSRSYDRLVVKKDSVKKLLARQIIKAQIEAANSTPTASECLIKLTAFDCFEVYDMFFAMMPAEILRDCLINHTLLAESIQKIEVYNHNIFKLLALILTQEQTLSQESAVVTVNDYMCFLRHASQYFQTAVTDEESLETFNALDTRFFEGVCRSNDSQGLVGPLTEIIFSSSPLSEIAREHLFFLNAPLADKPVEVMSAFLKSFFQSVKEGKVTATTQTVIDHFKSLTMLLAIETHSISVAGIALLINEYTKAADHFKKMLSELNTQLPLTEINISNQQQNGNLLTTFIHFLLIPTTTYYASSKIYLEMIAFFLELGMTIDPVLNELCEKTDNKTELRNSIKQLLVTRNPVYKTLITEAEVNVAKQKTKELAPPPVQQNAALARQLQAEAQRIVSSKLNPPQPVTTAPSLARAKTPAAPQKTVPLTPQVRSPQIQIPSPQLSPIAPPQITPPFAPAMTSLAHVLTPQIQPISPQLSPAATPTPTRAQEATKLDVRTSNASNASRSAINLLNYYDMKMNEQQRQEFATSQTKIIFDKVLNNFVAAATTILIDHYQITASENIHQILLTFTEPARKNDLQNFYQYSYFPAIREHDAFKILQGLTLILAQQQYADPESGIWLGSLLGLVLFAIHDIEWLFARNDNHLDRAKAETECLLQILMQQFKLITTEFKSNLSDAFIQVVKTLDGEQHPAGVKIVNLKPADIGGYIKNFYAATFQRLHSDVQNNYVRTAAFSQTPMSFVNDFKQAFYARMQVFIEFGDITIKNLDEWFAKPWILSDFTFLEEAVNNFGIAQTSQQNSYQFFQMAPLPEERSGFRFQKLAQENTVKFIDFVPQQFQPQKSKQPNNHSMFLQNDNSQPTLQNSKRSKSKKNARDDEAGSTNDLTLEHTQKRQRKNSS